jgi:hypothetical protein
MIYPARHPWLIRRRRRQNLLYRRQLAGPKWKGRGRQEGQSRIHTGRLKVRLFISQ